jgi:DNA invertase Pin-like site-specific DNA recombinase
MPGGLRGPVVVVQHCGSDLCKRKVQGGSGSCPCGCDPCDRIAVAAGVRAAGPDGVTSNPLAETKAAPPRPQDASPGRERASRGNMGPASSSRKIAAYLRVSSRSQDDATQLHAVERAAAARGDVVDEVYREKRTGKTLDRAELARVRAAARAGELRKLYVYRLDRLTRSGIRDTLDVIEELRAHGCELVSVSDAFDLVGPAAPVVIAVIAWAAEMERLAIGERISAARDRVERQGGRWGRPTRMSPKERERARAMQEKGSTISAIARALKVPRATIGRALRDVGR